MDLIEKFLPASFSEALGGTLAIIAILAGILSLFACVRAHTLRMLAIFVVTALALFSNNVTTYFIAIFVIATAVTELDFLQNLAAIVRGNKEYFDFKKESLSRERKLDLLAAETVRSAVVTESSIDNSAKDDVVEANKAEVEAVDEGASVNENKKDAPTFEEKLEKPTSSSARPDGVVDLAVGDVGHPTTATHKTSFPRASASTLSNDVRRIYELEGRAFDSLELLYETAIERGVRLRRGRVSVELDGLLTKFDGKKDLIFEVKYLRSSENFIAWIKLIGIKLRSLAGRYKEVTGEDALIHFVLILETGVMLTGRQRLALDELNVRDISVFTVDFLERDSLQI